MSTQVTVIGTLGTAPTFKIVPINKGKNAGEVGKVIEFSVRTEISQRQEDGTYRTLSEEWRSCEYWHENAEHFSKILQKGTPLIVIGTEYVKEYEKDGSSRTGRKIRVERLALNLNSRVEGIQLRPPKSASSADEASPVPQDLADDIPQ